MSQNTHNVLDDVKTGLKGIRGAGDALRGTFNESIDQAFNEPEGQVRNHAIAQKGVNDMQKVDDRVGGHHNLKAGGLNTTGQPADEVRTGETTGAGTHSAAPGSLGATGTATGAGTRGPLVQEDPGSTGRF